MRTLRNIILALVASLAIGCDSSSDASVKPSNSLPKQNNAPVIQNIGTIKVDQDQNLNYKFNINDADGDNLTAVINGNKPNFINFDPNTNAITGKPSNSDVGSYSLEIQASDGKDATKKAFTLVVNNVNDAPSISSIPLLTATEDQTFSYQVPASDPDNNALTFSLKNNSWVIINSQTGVLSGTPTNNNVGRTTLEAIVSDGKLSDKKTVDIDVLNTNDAPTITSQSITAASENSNYSYQVIANDVDKNDILTFGLTNNTSSNAISAGLTINASTGLITWNNARTGNHNIEVIVQDLTGANAKQSYTLVVDNSIHNISGTIKDTSGNSLQGITINLGNLVATTDFQGRYEFRNIPTGNYAIIFGDNFLTVYQFQDNINLANDLVKNIIMIKKTALQSQHADYRNSLGQQSFLVWFKKMTGTFNSQTPIIDRWIDNSLPINVFLNESEANTRASGYDTVSFDQNTGDIVNNANGTNDFVDFGRKAIAKINNIAGFTLLVESQSQTTIGIDFHYDTSANIGGLEGISTMDASDPTLGPRHFTITLNQDYRIPLVDINGNIIGFVNKNNYGLAAHEITHCLRFGHSEDVLHLMYKTGNGGSIGNGQREFNQDEVLIIKILYGLSFKQDMNRYSDQ